VLRWFSTNARHGWATCPFTECAFVRIVSNPAFSSDFLTVPDAVRLLKLNTEHPAHRFWAADISLRDAAIRFQGRLVGHKQVTDAYLLGLAMHRRGKLATLDEGVAALLDRKSSERECVELIASAS
jgi:predicted nucleic acid-binding protein